MAHRAECDAVVAECTSTWPTAQLDERLAEVGIPAAQINSTADVLEHPQLVERDRWRTVKTEAGEIRGVLPPMTFRDVELPMGPVPALGEHSAAIRAELQLPGDDPAVPEQAPDVERPGLAGGALRVVLPRGIRSWCPAADEHPVAFRVRRVGTAGRA